MDLVIMAAGMGSRFGGLKQIEPINDNGEFIIDYSIYDAIRYGFDRVVFIIKKEIYDIFRETVGKRIEKKIKVEYVFQELNMLPKGYKMPEERVKPWGTGHAILCCKNIVKNNFAIINADDFYGRDAFKVLAEFLKTNSDNNYAVVGYKVDNTLADVGATKRGVCAVKNSMLNRIVESNVVRENGKIFATPLGSDETKEIDKNSIVSMNMFGFTPKLFDVLESEFKNFLNATLTTNPLKSEFLIPTIVDGEIAKGQIVQVLDTSAVWYGVTYKEDKEKVVNALRLLSQNGEYPLNLWGRK